MTSNSRCRNLFVTLLTVLCLAASPFLHAQITTATILGTVSDPTGGVIPNADVTATNVATGFTKTVNANDQGDYRLEFLPIGDYKLEVKASGFKTTVQRLTLNLNDELHYNATLEIGSASETVTVNAGEPLVQTASSSIGRTVDNVEVDNLPIVNRNVYDLLNLTPGVQSNQSTATLGFPQQIVLINGSSDGDAGSVSYYLDGGINMTMVRNTGNVVPNPDALQEFDVQTSNYNALYGRMSAGLVNVVTKSGTNSMHGSIFEFFRSDKLNSTPGLALSKSPLHRNQFGATLGGPIIKDKTFFFGSYAGLRQTTSQLLSTAVVPTAAERASGFTDFSDKLPTSSGTITACNPTLSAADTAAGNFVMCNPTTRKPITNNNLSTAGLAPDPTALNVLKTYVPAGNSTSANGQPVFVGYVPLPLVTDEFLIKVDHQLTGAHRLEMMYFNTAGNSLNFPGGAINPGGTLPWSVQIFNYRQQNANLSDTWTISPTKINQAYATYTRLIGGRVNSPGTSLHDLGSTFTPQGEPSLPQIAVTNYFTLGNTIAGPEAGTDFYALRDVFSWNIGKHALAFGGEASLNKDVLQTLLDNFGIFSFAASKTARTGTPLGDFVLGMPSAVEQDAPVTALDNDFFYGLFLQDDWKVTSRLTINAGLRYDIQTPPTDPQNRLDTFVPGRQSTLLAGAPTGLLIVGDPGVGRGIASIRYHHVSPRMGFAWDPFGTGKTAVRGAAGVFYGMVSGNEWNSMSNFLPFAVRDKFASNLLGTLTNPYAKLPGGDPFPYTYVPGAPFPTKFEPAGLDSISQNIQWPYSYQTNFSVQQQFAHDFTVTVSYVGSFAHDLPFGYDINAPQLKTLNGAAPTTSNADQRRPNQPGVLTSVLQLNSGATSHYHGLQVDFEKRLSRSFSLKGFYTWSKALSSTEEQNSTPVGLAQDYYALQEDYGRTDSDIRHQSVTSIVWKPSFFESGPRYVRGTINGWTLSGIISLQSGLPFTVTTGVDNNLDGTSSTDRATIVPGQSFSSHAGNNRASEEAGYFNKAYFCSTNGTTCPGIGPGLLDGTSRRNQFTGPGSKNVNAALFRDFPIYERFKLQARAEVTNVFNFVNLANPNSSLSSSTFGQILSSTPNSFRQIQLGARILF